VYILVHLEVSVRRKVVDIAQPLEEDVGLGVAGGHALHTERRGGGRVVRLGRALLWSPGLRFRAGLRHRVVHAQTLSRSPAVPSITMATTQECRSALDKLSDNLANADGAVRGAAALDRSLSCHITDLDITFTGRLDTGRIKVLDTLQGAPRDKAQIRLAMKGDDLVAMVNGELNFAKAWASGRVRLEAGFRDLLRLRTLL
jgi:hypothetical protein